MVWKSISYCSPISYQLIDGRVVQVYFLQPEKTKLEIANKEEEGEGRREVGETEGVWAGRGRLGERGSSKMRGMKKAILGRSKQHKAKHSA